MIDLPVNRESYRGGASPNLLQPDPIRLQRLYRKQGLQIIGITYPPQTAREVSRFAKRFKNELSSRSRDQGHQDVIYFKRNATPVGHN